MEKNLSEKNLGRKIMGVQNNFGKNIGGLKKFCPPPKKKNFYILYCLLGALSAKSTAFPWHQTLLLGECVGCWNSHHGSQNNNIAIFENNCVFQHVLAVISKCLTLQT